MQLSVKIALVAIFGIIPVEVHGSRTYHNRPWYPHHRDYYRFENLGRHGPHGRYGPYSEHRSNYRQHHRRPYYEDFRPPWVNSEETSESDSESDSRSYDDSYGSSEEYTWYNYGHRHRWRHPPRVTNTPGSRKSSSRTTTKKLPSTSRWHSIPSKRPSINEHRNRGHTKFTTPRTTFILSEDTTRQRTKPSEVFLRETATTIRRPTPKTNPSPKPVAPYSDDYEDYNDNNGGNDNGGEDDDSSESNAGDHYTRSEGSGGNDHYTSSKGSGGNDHYYTSSEGSGGNDHYTSSEGSGDNDHYTSSEGSGRLLLSPLPLLLSSDSSRGSGGNLNDISRNRNENHSTKNIPKTNPFKKPEIIPTSIPEIDQAAEIETKPTNTIQDESTDSSSLESNTVSQTVVYCLDNCVPTGDFNPVCGTNGESYDNFGQLFCAKSCGINVEFLRVGRCIPLSPLPDERDDDDDVNGSIHSRDGDLNNSSKSSDENRSTKNVHKTNLITKPTTDSTSTPKTNPPTEVEIKTTVTLEKNLSSSSLQEPNTLSQTTVFCLENCITIGEFNPICGTNGETYDNFGQLFCAKSCGINVEVQRVGKCMPLSPLTDDYLNNGNNYGHRNDNGSGIGSGDDRNDSSKGSNDDNNDSSESTDVNHNDNSEGSGDNELSFPRLHLLTSLDDSGTNNSNNSDSSRNTPITKTTEAEVIPTTETKSATTPEKNLTTPEIDSTISTSPNPNTISPTVLDCIENCVATSEFNPVCGTDGQDFDNIGQLYCAKNCGINVELARWGRCSPRRHFPDDYEDYDEDDDDDDEDDSDVDGDDDDDDSDDKTSGGDKVNSSTSNDGDQNDRSGNLTDHSNSSKTGSDHNDNNNSNGGNNVNSSISTDGDQNDRNRGNITDYNTKNGSNHNDSSREGDLNGNENVQNGSDAGDAAVTTVSVPTSPTTRSPNLRRTTELTSFHLCMRLCPIKITISPVCGTDFVTYINVDRMLCARGCGKDVQVLCSQPCGVCNLNVRPLSSNVMLSTTPMPSTIGLMKQCVEACPVNPEYNPVCGTNQVTYRNAVHLVCVQMCGDDVKAMHFGLCPPIHTEASVAPPITTVAPMTTTIAPMILTEAPIGTTEEDDDDITLPPEVIECVRHCPVTAEYDPVCGTNEVTYVNRGRLECAKYCLIEVEFSYKGLCRGFFSSAGGRATQSWEILRNSTTANPLLTTLTSAQTTTTIPTTSVSSTMFASITSTTAVTGVPNVITEPPIKTTEEDYDDITLPPEVIECVRHCPVTSEYDPVCGTNEVTYVNRGRLECAKYCKIDVEMSYKGLCNGFFSSVGGRATESWEILRNATTRSPPSTPTLSSVQTSPTAIPTFQIKSSSSPITLPQISLLPLIHSSNTSSISTPDNTIATTRIDRSKFTLFTATETPKTRNVTINRNILSSIFGVSLSQKYATTKSEDSYSLDPRFGKENETTTDRKEILDPERIIFRD